MEQEEYISRNAFKTNDEDNNNKSHTKNSKYKIYDESWPILVSIPDNEHNEHNEFRAVHKSIELRKQGNDDEEEKYNIETFRKLIKSNKFALLIGFLISVILIYILCRTEQSTSVTQKI